MNSNDRKCIRNNFMTRLITCRFNYFGIGCDPAQHYFQNIPPFVRLYPSDADFVDVKHSDATDIMFIGK